MSICNLRKQESKRHNHVALLICLFVFTQTLQCGYIYRQTKQTVTIKTTSQASKHEPHRTQAGRQTGKQASQAALWLHIQLLLLAS